MLTLILDSNKKLSYTATTAVYSNENKFDTIRVIASPLIDGKNIDNYKVELYVYNVLSKDWNTFNDCVPCDFTLDNDKYIFDTPVKLQYTAYPCIGMYCRFIGENGVVGKTNVVNIPVLYHRDNNIDVGNSIELFEKYKSDMQKNIQNSVSDRRVWFKKNCPNWTTPRIYLFTNTNMNNSEAPEICDRFSNINYLWHFEDSPYMIQDDNEKDLYYYDIPICQYRNVIFFCDVKDSSGFNYKTADLVIPQGYLYGSLYYWQSPIGFDGIWADKLTNSFKLFIQCGFDKSAQYWVTPYTLSVKINDIDAPVYKLGIKGCGGSDRGKHYFYVNIPLTVSTVDVNVQCDWDSTIPPVHYNIHRTLELKELCYNYSALYENYGNGGYELCNYDISCDEVFMFQTRYSAAEYQLYRDAYKYFDIYNMSQSLNNLDSEFRNFYKPDYSFTNKKFYSEDSDDDEIYTDIRLTCRSCKIGSMVICNFELFFTIDTNGDNQTPKIVNFQNMLPYAKNNSAYQPIISPFTIVRPAGAVKTQPQYYDCYKHVTSVNSTNALALYSCDSTTNVSIILNGAYNTDFEERSAGVYTGYVYTNLIYNS